MSFNAAAVAADSAASSGICSRLLRTKSLAEARSLHTPLKRCLSVWHLTFYGIAHMAGAGIYVLTGTVLKDRAGPAASISFLLCAVASLFTGLCYVEFSTYVPRAGSCYTFTYLTLGELPAFIVGWTMIADMIIGMASVAKAFSGTVDALAGNAVSNWTAEHFGELSKSELLDPTIDLVAFGLILLLMLLTVCGASVSMSLNIVLSGLQCCSLLLIAVFSFVYGSAENWSASSGGFLPFGVPGVVSGATVAIFAFSGFEAIANAAEECRDPRRSLPIALLASLAVITVLYFFTSLGLSYLELYSDIDVASPFVSAFRHSRGGRWMQYVAAAGTLMATGATKLASIYVLPRMLYALAADGVIWRSFAYIHPKCGVPLVGLGFGGLLSALLALVFNIGTLASFVSMGVLLSYLMIGVDLFYLRYFYFHTPGSSSSSSSSGSMQFANLRFLRPWASRIASCCPRILFCIRRHSTLCTLFLAYLVACLVASLMLNYVLHYMTWWAVGGTVAAALALAAIGACLCMYEPEQLDCYAAPMMPMPPLVSLFINSLLITRLEWLTWVRFAVWLLLGIAIYSTYGIRNTGDNNKQQTSQSASTTDYMQLPTVEANGGGESEEVESFGSCEEPLLQPADECKS